jgi:hypothetical protein
VGLVLQWQHNVSLALPSGGRWYKDIDSGLRRKIPPGIQSDFHSHLRFQELCKKRSLLRFYSQEYMTYARVTKDNS